MQQCVWISIVLVGFCIIADGSDAAVSAENNNEETPAQPPVQNTRPQRRRPVAPAASAPDAETPQKSSSESSVPNSNPFRRRPAAPPVQPEEPQQEVQQQRREQLPAVQSTSSLADVDAADPAADGEFVSECPIADGFFADAFECDRYYECRGNKISEKVCKDGLVFNDYSVKFGRCDFPFNVDCTDRPKLQPAQPSPNCPRSNGYFAHPDPKECTKFFFCSDGVDNPITCPGGLIFDPKKGQCAWPEDAKREGCLAEELFEFNCPKQSNQDFNGPQRQQHPRFADPKDCQFFYLCIDGVTPRKNGCPLGRVFNQETGLCDEPENVLDCIDWYKDDPRFLTSTTSTSPRPRPTAKNSRVRPNRTRATTARALTRFSDRNVQKQEQQTF
ncbi:unnamed protein product [Notodromas monacha]|uniref:Chitin-binding type-2 domain-containing protein n=1 Tax=Notodromas monacha TaxID=399045 RepID=A0A7R9BYL4_9CRUS|nr:unnamed protein product [Notodromas monacha]CAG0923057.1 unnamed protein product [Notodromas monacha]